MFCPKCGTSIPGGSNFCPSCGWKVGSQLHSPNSGNVATRVAQGIANKVNQATGYNDVVELKVKDFFSDVFKRHTHEDVERLFACGSPETTPPLATVTATWPRPWAYARVFAVLLASLLMSVVLSLHFGNHLGLPAVFILSAAVVNVSAVVFFLEANIARNVSFADVLRILLAGGMASILLLYFLPIQGGTGDLVPSFLTGLKEELAKALITAFFLNQMKDKRYILNGLIIGAAVGGGFALFEDSGYIFAEYSSLGVEGILGTALERGLTGLCGHVAWAAAEGGALALCNGTGEFSWKNFIDKRFLSILAICIFLHGIWDSFINELFGEYAMTLIFTSVIWIVLIVLLHRGVSQINVLAKQAAVSQQ